MNLESASQVFQILSTLLIIFLLAVQSWVLYKLLPEIKKVSKNSESVTKMAKKEIPFSTRYENHITFNNPLNCTNPLDSRHIHSAECFQ